MADITDFQTPITPGEILKEEFMEPYGLSANRLASAIGVPTNRITGIINGTRAITAATALRLAAAFETTPEFWLNAQTQFELEAAKENPLPTIVRIAETMHATR